MIEKTEVRYPGSWYPVMKANSLKKKTSRAVRAFGREWLVFRGADGRPGMIDRYCCHMGADLQKGKVVGDCVECALHGWQFNREGNCRKIPALKAHELNQLTRHRQASLPCREEYGLIFVYFGESPEFDIPAPSNMPSFVWNTSYVFDLDTEYHTPCLNTFDIQHYRNIHHRALSGDPLVESFNQYHLRIDMSSRIVPGRFRDRIMQVLVKGEVRTVIDCWGASMLLMSNTKTGYGCIIGLVPIDKMKSRIFLVPTKEVQSPGKRSASFLERLQLRITGWFVKGFLKPDRAVLSGMRPVRGDLLDGHDDIARTYWDFYQGLPTFTLEKHL